MWYSEQESHTHLKIPPVRNMSIYLVTRNQAIRPKSGEGLIYVLMCGMAWLRPDVSADHLLVTQRHKSLIRKYKSVIILISEKCSKPQIL